MVLLSIDNPSDAEQRIDKFIRKYLPNAPLGGIFKWLRTGKIKVNNKKVDQTYRLCLGDTLSFYLSPEEMGSFRVNEIQNSPKKPLFNPEELEIIYEDEYILILNKPSGMNVHPGDHKSTEVSLIELVQDALGKRYDTLSFKPSLVHRIDRDTSGCIMIAKEKKVLEALLTQLQNDGIKKKYHTIVIGVPEPKKGTIDAKLLRVENAKDEAKVRIDEMGQRAITHYHVISEIIGGKYSLIECEIETGRTHQIRVHLSSLGNPILGDKSYGNMKENSFARREYNIHRQLLHAHSLTFIHPITRKSIRVEAPYQEDMEVLLSREK